MKLLKINEVNVYEKDQIKSRSDLKHMCARCNCPDSSLPYIRFIKDFLALAGVA